jgi:hypothetical protein
VNGECKQALCNEWYEFEVLGKGKKLNELLNLALANHTKMMNVVSECKQVLLSFLIG